MKDKTNSIIAWVIIAVIVGIVGFIVVVNVQGIFFKKPSAVLCDPKCNCTGDCDIDPDDVVCICYCSNPAYPSSTPTIYRGMCPPY